jgi:hypothetical protein
MRIFYEIRLMDDQGNAGCFSGQGRRIFQTTGAAALHRGSEKYENAGLECKMRFPMLEYLFFFF